VSGSQSEHDDVEAYARPLSEIMAWSMENVEILAASGLKMR
jgi:hypothetical protein